MDFQRNNPRRRGTLTDREEPSSTKCVETDLHPCNVSLSIWRDFVFRVASGNDKCCVSS